MDIDPRSRIAAASWARVELQRAPAELDGVVLGDGAAVLEAADAGEGRRRRAPGRVGRGGGLGEAGVVAWPEAVKDLLGLGEGPGLREAELDDQAILEGAKEPFDPALALRRGGRDPADAEFSQRTSHLRGGNGALELLRHALRRLRSGAKDPMPIGVDCGGQAIAADEVPQQEEIAVRIFLGAKDTGEDFARGVIDGGEEDEARAAVLEPGVVAAVHLDEEAGLRHALAAAPMPGGPSAAGTADAGAPEEPLHGLAGHVQALPLRQQLGEVVVIHAGVGGARQGEDAGPDGLRYTPWRRAPAVPVGQRGGTMLPPAGEQAPDVSERQGQEPAGLSGMQDAIVDVRQHMQPLVLPLGQGDRLPVHPPRVTDSLTRWWVTESLTYYTGMLGH